MPEEGQKKEKKSKVLSRRRDSDDYDSSAAPTASGPMGPQMLLEGTGFMHWGPMENANEGVKRSVQALKLLAESTSKPPKNVPPQAGEDPVVGELLGDTSGVGKGMLPGREQPPTSDTHYGFICDATNAEPIIGIRYKATGTFDHDINEQSRRAGKFAGGCGFFPLPTATHAMRLGLGATLRWWSILWPTRGDLFGATPPDLASLEVSALAKAISNLPEVPALGSQR